ncbi:hypothetical protein COCOBI_02-4400 [Coccomyxa sp. Obi]|nr:hypothetical protein COCOBI_02-4400 [Coccomyxa sp. Obi]
MSATPKPTGEEAAPPDASHDLQVGNAGKKESNSQPSTDGCVVHNEGMNAARQNTENSASSLQSERTVDVATQEDHSGPAVVEEFTSTSTDGSEQISTEHRAHNTDATSAEEGEAATILNDDSSNVFGDFEDVKEGTLQSKGDTDAIDDAESEDGFGGFEEADARSAAESVRGDNEDEVKAEALSSSESNIPKLIPTVSAAGSSADIFTTGRADFFAQVRKLLCPSAVTASEQDGNEEWPCISLDLLIHQLATPQSSTKFVHASVIGAKQVTPIKWEGSTAERRFLSRFATSQVESSARQQRSTGHQHAQTDDAGKVTIFAALGTVVNGEYLAGSSGAGKDPVENGDHAGIMGAAPTQASGNVELQDQSALDTSGFGAWATDPTLIPGIPSSSNTGADREPDHSTPAASSAALAHLQRRASPRRGSDTVSSRHAGTSPSRLRSSSLPKAEQTGAKQFKMHLPDLSFMLSDTLVSPR